MGIDSVPLDEGDRRDRVYRRGIEATEKEQRASLAVALMAVQISADNFNTPPIDHGRGGYASHAE